LFLNSVHGKRSCQSCHAGQADSTFTTMEEAHVDMIPDPSAVGACDGCHYREARATANSLHTNLWGEKAAIELRARIIFEGSQFEDDYNERCGGCHTTCGQCHISRPNSVGGGFPKIGTYYSHRFRKSPDMNEQCTACHGSRVGTDYKGEIEGNQPDVHRTRGYKCEFCHTKEEIHGDGLYDGERYNHRYEVKSMPRCENCHGSTGGNQYHQTHVTGTGPKLQCQVCHSQPYKNCTNCHGFDTPDFDIDPSVVQLKIAKNVSPYRPEYEYSIVRHVPIDPDTYAGWGMPLPGYLDKPTWLYASPHNILRWTPQTTVGENDACFETCHNTQDGPDGFFLRESDLYEEDGVTKLPDYDANIDIVIDESFPAVQ
jgi:thiosulfate/3-mercaptopyruvate sulfurtransferase